MCHPILPVFRLSRKYSGVSSFSSQSLLWYIFTSCSAFSRSILQLLFLILTTLQTSASTSFHGKLRVGSKPTALTLLPSECANTLIKVFAPFLLVCCSRFHATNLSTTYDAILSFCLGRLFLPVRLWQMFQGNTSYHL